MKLSGFYPIGRFFSEFIIYTSNLLYRLWDSNSILEEGRKEEGLEDRRFVCRRAAGGRDRHHHAFWPGASLSGAGED